MTVGGMGFIPECLLMMMMSNNKRPLTPKSMPLGDFATSNNNNSINSNSNSNNNNRLLTQDLEPGKLLRFVFLIIHH